MNFPHFMREVESYNVARKAEDDVITWFLFLLFTDSQSCPIQIIQVYLYDIIVFIVHHFYLIK